MTPEQAAWYLAAMIDGEGCVYYKKNRASGSGPARCVQVTNSDADLLDATERAATVLGLGCAPRVLVGDGTRGNRKPCWSIRINGGREAFARLLEVVPLQSRRKLAALRELVASYPPKPARPTVEQLREQYVDRGWTKHQVGQFWGVDGATVGYWMKRDGVPSRSMSETKGGAPRSANGTWRRHSA